MPAKDDGATEVAAYAPHWNPVELDCRHVTLDLSHTAAWLIPAFALFRLFDIVKPWPIGWLDRRVHGGFGIMLDDLVAGLYAALPLAGVLVVLK